jgi:hypothetical protein
MREDVEHGDMFAIYAHLGTMKRLWEKRSRGYLHVPHNRRQDQRWV